MSYDYEIDLADILSVPQELTPAVYQYYKNLKERKIIINDAITEEIVESVMLPLMEMDNDGSGKPITIYLSTTGGSPFEGMPLCDIIGSLKTPTEIIVLTYAYSMGSLVLMAGHNNPKVKRKCFKHSTALVHSGSTYLEGNAGSVKDTFHFQQDYEQMIREYIITHSKITEEEYEKMERFEWWMNSKTMLDKGLIDEII